MLLSNMLPRQSQRSAAMAQRASKQMRKEGLGLKVYSFLFVIGVRRSSGERFSSVCTENEKIHPHLKARKG